MNRSTPSYPRSNRGGKPPSAAQTSSRPPPGGPARRNTSILNFFKKTEAPTPLKPIQKRITQYIDRQGNNGSGKERKLAEKKDDGSQSLFFGEDIITRCEESDALYLRSGSPDDDFGDFGYETSTAKQEEERYNERPYDGSMKRRKVRCEADDIEPAKTGSREPQSGEVGLCSETGLGSTDISTADERKNQNRGPFLDESDSDDDVPAMLDKPPNSEPSRSEVGDSPMATTSVNPGEDADVEDTDIPFELVNSHPARPLANEEDSCEEEATLKGNELLSDMENEDACDPDSLYDLQTGTGYMETADRPPDDEVAVCPICRVSLDGMSDTVSAGQTQNILYGSTLTCFIRYVGCVNTCKRLS